MSSSRDPTPTFELYPKQQDVRLALTGPERHCLIYGGSRSGKTFLFCYAIAVRALSAPFSRHLIARLHNIDVRQAILQDTWPKMMAKAFPGLAYSTNKSDQFVTLPNGSEIWFGGLDDKERVDKILGKEFATIYVNEASQVSYASIVTLRTRLAQVCIKTNGKPLAQKAYYDLNPTGQTHWTYREFVKGVRPDNGMPITPGTRIFRVMNPRDNPALGQDYIGSLAEMPERQRKRFLEGEYASQVPGALWNLDRIDELRVANPQPLSRIVVAIDPAATSGDQADDSGIIVAGKSYDDHAYVLHDGSLNGSPDDVCREAVRLYGQFDADRIVAEANNGGDWIEAVLRNADADVPYRKVTASRGKVTRAEPASALYEQGKVHHVGVFADLEEQMCFPAGTLIETSEGQRPIETVATGDFVMTRQGFFPVKSSGETGCSSEFVVIETTDGREIRCTPTHPIFSANQGEFVSARSVSVGMFLSVRLSPASTETPSPGGVTGTIECQAVTSGTHEANYFTGRSGKPIADPSRPASMSTIATKTPDTIGSGISNFERRPSMTQSMRQEDFGRSALSAEALTQNEHGKPASASRSSASNAARRVSPLTRAAASSATIPVNIDTPLGRKSQTEFAHTARQHFPQGTPAENIAVKCVTTLRTTPESVFNLSVDGPSEYYANGILVHNCDFTTDFDRKAAGYSPDRVDALVWALKELFGGPEMSFTTL